MKTYYCAKCERIYKSSRPLETCGLCGGAVTEEAPRIILPKSMAQSSSGTLGKRAFPEFEHVLNDFHHPNPQPGFEWPEELQAGTKRQRKLPRRTAARSPSTDRPREEFVALGKPPFRRLRPEGKKPHTYTRSAKSKNHGEPFAPFRPKDKKDKVKVVSANVGGFENFLKEFNREPGEIETSLVKEKERWQGNGALYEQLRVYSLHRCELLIDTVKRDLPAEHAALVYFVNDYPCVHIDVSSYAEALTKGTDGEVEAFSEYMSFVLNGYIDYFAHQQGFTTPCVCRSSFGFLTPTTAPTVESVRLSLGLAPEGYLGCVVLALERFLGHLDELTSDEVQNTVPENSFFAQRAHRTYLETKEKQRQQNLKNKKKQVTPRQPFVYDDTSTVRDHLTHNISSQKGLMQEVTRTFGGGSHATQLGYSALKQNGNGILAALQGSLAKERWKITNKGNTLSYVEPKYYRYEASAPSPTVPSSLKDAEFTNMTDAILKAAGMSVENGILSQDARWMATLFAAEDIYRQGISVYRKRSGETEEYEDGSDSEHEDEELYHCKLISQNGMNAIGLALVFAQLWFKGEAKQTSASIFMEEMYFEAPHLLAINKWLEKTKQLAQSSILMGDLNHCVTSLAKQSRHAIGEQSWSGKRVVIVDVTSSTLRRMREMVQKFKEDEPDVLLLVSSGLKHEQLGTDKNAYGTVRFFVAATRKDKLGQYFTKLKNHPAYKKQPIVSHSVRRAFKSIGAVPTIDAILHPQESTST